jgi:hypothetical protein
MNSNRNGHQQTAIMPIAIAVSTAAENHAADLDAWDSEIANLNIALRDLAVARAQIEIETEALERVEADVRLSVEGQNADIRRARLTLALADDRRHVEHTAALRGAKAALLDADRRVTVAKERCRLLRNATASADN